MSRDPPTSKPGKTPAPDNIPDNPFSGIYQEEVNEHLETFWSGMRFVAASHSPTMAQDVEELWMEMVAGLRSVFDEHSAKFTSEGREKHFFMYRGDDRPEKGMMVSTMFDNAKARKFIPPSWEWETSGSERSLTVSRLLKDLKEGVGMAHTT